MDTNLLKTIETIYDCVGNQFDHQKALRSFGLAVDNTGLILTEIWPLIGKANVLAVHNIPEDAVKAMISSFVSIENNSMLQNLPKIPVGVPVLRRAFVSDEEHFASAMYKKTSEPWELHSEGVSIFSKGLISVIACGFVRKPNQSEINAETISRMAIISKHYLKAMKIHTKLDRLQTALLSSSDILDLVDFGIILYDKNKEIVQVNSAAQRVLDKMDGLSITKSGLKIFDREAQKEYADILDANFDNKRAAASLNGGLVTVKRPSRQKPFGLLTIPMDISNNDTNPRGIATLIFDHSAKKVTAIKHFATVYGFTKVESRLALEIAQGTSLEEYAQKFKVSLHTVRVQLRALFSKTGVTRQGELVSLLLRSTSGLNLK
ncbi:helix-turn-helix transcriptional regulator [Lentilitoribacter sp. Alg239-R112]|uniref:helix-turn-helix transcriptional regulator n=1 Tax=Lentilitoribacter sp. Alg239-R112 TaxID=2305987 RepID=UPI0013A6F1E6|nr:helix-turn-helix transcriptional regulator [Lentilitoribacter sp. Alg239-R112]